MAPDRINLDRLAEAYYAKYDPAFQAEEDELEEQRERFEARTMTVVERNMRQLLDLLSEDEIDVLRNNFDAICDYLGELLEV